jgi:putative FmdB family regulatory protein
MPSYEYKCIHCGAEEERIGGLDDNTALCVDCGNLMLRLDEDVFRPYFEAAVEKRQIKGKKMVASGGGNV